MQIGDIILTEGYIEDGFSRKKPTSIPQDSNGDNTTTSPPIPVPTDIKVNVRVPLHVYKQLEEISECKNIYPIVLDDLNNNNSINGYGFISGVEYGKYYKGSELVHVSFDVNILHYDEKTYLKMDYTNGTESNSVIEMTYTDFVEETVFSEYFNSFDTDGAWESPISSGLTNASISVPTGTGKLALTGTASSNNKRGTIFTVTQNPVDPPFTMDFNMEWARYATTYGNQFQFRLYPEKPTSITEFYNNDHISAYLYVKPTYTGLHFKKRINNKEAELVIADTLTTSEKTPSLRFILDNKDQLSIWKDTLGRDIDTYGTKVWGAKNPGWDIDEGLYVALGFANWKNTAETLNCAGIEAYNNIKTYPRNIVPFPVNSNIINAPSTFTRNSEEGTITLAINPNDYLIFQSNYSDWDLGAVKVYNNINELQEYKRIYNNENSFTKTSWYVSNGLIKLYTDSNNNINFQYWDGTQYVTLKQFNIGTINYINPFYISSDRCIIQINGTYWWIFRGKPFILVNHPEDRLYFTRGTCYDHDGGFTSVGADNVEITMASQFYCNVWNMGSGTCTSPVPDANYRLQIIKTDPKSIYSNYIPQDQYTGIGVINYTVTSETNNNHYVKIAREFFNMVDTKITL
jgi:hypothetical protein